MNSKTFPSLRGHVGDWVYYVTLMTFQDVKDCIKRADEIHQSKGLRDMIQRALTDRTGEIAEYLKTQPQRFFNAIVVGIYGGEPQWSPISIGDSPRLGSPNLSEASRHSIGLLSLSGGEKIFAIDGQHRVEAIKAVLADTTKIAEEEICAIFVGHKMTESGRQRTRRLFTTLNKYAKPVSPGEIVALDEDNAFAITTRRLVEEYEPLKGTKVLFAKTPPIPRKERKAFTTVLSLFDLVEVLSVSKTESNSAEVRRMKNRRPSDDKLEEIYSLNEAFWNALQKHVKPVKEALGTDTDEPVAAKYRTVEGGHLLFRPAGQRAFAHATRVLRDRGMTMNNAVGNLSKVNMNLNTRPWINVLWDSVGKRMVKSVNTQLAQNLFLRMIRQETFPATYDLHGQYQKALRDEGADVEKDIKA